MAENAKERAKRWDPEFGETYRSLACDCGNVKGYAREACEACTALDGLGAQGELISYMRSVGGHFTIQELVEALERDSAAVWRTLHTLIRRGRIVKRELVVGYEGRVHVYGSAQMVATSCNGTVNVYALIDRRR